MRDDELNQTSSSNPFPRGEAEAEEPTTPGSPPSPSTPTGNRAWRSDARPSDMEASEPDPKPFKTVSEPESPPEPEAAPESEVEAAPTETEIYWTDPIPWKGMTVLVCKVCGWRTVKGIEAMEGHVYGRHVGVEGAAQAHMQGRTGLVGPHGQPL